MGGIEKYDVTIDEAYEFIRRAAIARCAELNSKESWYLHPKETGAVKRASMDLTRALAEFRNPK